MDIYEESRVFHEKLKGKLEVKSKIHVKNSHDLSLAYTPGVAEPCRQIKKNPDDVFKYTMKGNCVGVVSDGSAVLGLGNIGAKAALPVMEGKALLFREFAGIDAFPICIESQDPDEIIKIVKNISPVFGGINLEDIASPHCFKIEESLQDLGISVMHDDQHGTAVVVLAALTNALKVAKKDFGDVTVAISVAGAAATAVAKMLLGKGLEGANFSPVKEVILFDTKGIIYEGRPDLNNAKQEIAKITNRGKIKGSFHNALDGADVLIGLSAPNIFKKEDIGRMNDKAIVFAMANPVPEIMPNEAIDGGAFVVATGRSDFPNQVNNVLCFPGIFRGALDCRAVKISQGMKLAASRAISNCVKNPDAGNIIPSPLDKSVVPAVASAVKKQAIAEGLNTK